MKELNFSFLWELNPSLSSAEKHSSSIVRAMKVVQGSCVRWSKPQLKMSLKLPKLETENQKHSWNSVRRNTARSRRDPCFYQPRCVSVCVSLCTLWKCNTMWYIIVRSDKTVLNYVCDVSVGAVCHFCADAKLMPVSCSYVKKATSDCLSLWHCVVFHLLSDLSLLF